MSGSCSQRGFGVEAELVAVRRRARALFQQLSGQTRLLAITLYAAAPAQRLYGWNATRRATSNRGEWSLVLDDVWAHLAGEVAAMQRIKEAVARFHLDLRTSVTVGCNDCVSDDYAVAATVYAAHSAIHGLPEFAFLSAARATDYLEVSGRPLELRSELVRQNTDLAAITAAADARHLRERAPADLIVSLRA